MKNIEYKVIRFLIFILLVFLNYHILMLFTSFIAPEGFLSDLKRIGGFFINLLGLHAMFAFGTFFYSRMYLNIKIKFYLLGLSIFTPFPITVSFKAPLSIEVFDPISTLLPILTLPI